MLFRMYVASWIYLYLKISHRQTVERQLITIGVLGVLCSMCNYIFVPFAAALGMAIVVSVIFSRGTTQQQLKRVLRWYIATQIPAAIATTIFLFSYSQFGVIMDTTRFIPRPTPLSLVSLTANYLNLNNYYYEYPEGNLREQQNLTYLNIASAAYFIVFLIIIKSNKKTKYAFFWPFSLLVLLTIVLHIGGIYVISIVSDRSFFIPRFFAPSGGLFRLWLALMIDELLYICVDVKTRLIMLAIASTYFVSFFAGYSDKHQVFTIYEPNAKSIQKTMNVGQSLIHEGDLVAFVPAHYQDLYPEYYFHGEVSKVLQNQTSKQISTVLEHPEIVANNYRRLIIFVASYVNYYEQQDISNTEVEVAIRYLRQLKSLCTSRPKIEVDNQEFSVLSCSLDQTVRQSF